MGKRRGGQKSKVRESQRSGPDQFLSLENYVDGSTW